MLNHDPEKVTLKVVTLKSGLEVTHSLTAALDQLRVVASSTSNDPGPRSRQHQQIGQCHSRSLKLVPFESLCAVSYSPSVVTMVIFCIVCEFVSDGQTDKRIQLLYQYADARLQLAGLL